MNQEPQKGWEPTGDLKLWSFHCSSHGKIKPVPRCLQCLTSEREVILKGVDKALRENVEDGKVELICQNIRDSLKK